MKNALWSRATTPTAARVSLREHLTHVKCTRVHQHVWLTWQRRDHEIRFDENAVGGMLWMVKGETIWNDTKHHVLITSNTHVNNMISCPMCQMPPTCHMSNLDGIMSNVPETTLMWVISDISIHQVMRYRSEKKKTNEYNTSSDHGRHTCQQWNHNIWSSRML